MNAKLLCVLHLNSIVQKNKSPDGVICIFTGTTRLLKNTNSLFKCE